MINFKVCYSGACFESGDSRELVEKRVHDKVASIGKIMDIEATPLRADESRLGEENYVVSFEGEITVQAETQVEAENQAYDRLSRLGQITVVATSEKQ